VNPFNQHFKREDIDKSLLINWIKEFESVEYNKEFPGVLRISHNVCGFLKGLYFRIIFNLKPKGRFLWLVRFVFAVVIDGKAR